MTHGSLFSGVGGFDLAAEWMGWENLFHCEINEWCQKVLRFHFPKSIQYDDITRTDFTPWRGKVDVLTGGFPCQPFSTAGKRRGAEDDRYLWPEMLRAIREIRPAWVIGENVAGITSMVQPGSEVTVESQASLFETSDKETLLEQEYIIETVCRDLEREGYSVQPVVIPACGVGAPHRRDRVWFIASDRSDARIEGLRQERENEIHGRESTSHSNGTRFQAKGTEQQTTGIAGSRLQGLITNAEGKQLENTLRAWRRITGSTNLYRKKDWRNFPTQPPVRFRYDGISNNVVRYIKTEVYDAIKKHIRREDLPCVWENFQKKEIRKQIGRLYEIPEPDLLLEVLQRTSKDERHEQRQIGISQFSEETSERVLRYLRNYGTFASSPLGQKYKEQFFKQFGDFMPELSHEIALATKKIVEECERTASYVRQESIKSYGNAIVPQVAFEIFKAIEASIHSS
jgi:DNA (cytosine-5)-methyltransferase 1